MLHTLELDDDELGLVAMAFAYTDSNDYSRQFTFFKLRIAAPNKYKSLFDKIDNAMQKMVVGTSENTSPASREGEGSLDKSNEAVKALKDFENELINATESPRNPRHFDGVEFVDDIIFTDPTIED